MSRAIERVSVTLLWRKTPADLNWQYPSKPQSISHESQLQHRPSFFITHKIIGTVNVKAIRKKPCTKFVRKATLLFILLHFLLLHHHPKSIYCLWGEAKLQWQAKWANKSSDQPTPEIDDYNLFLPNAHKERKLQRNKSPGERETQREVHCSP